MKFGWSLMICVAVLGYGQSSTHGITNIAPPPSARFPASWYPPDSDVTSTMSPETDAPYSATLVTTMHFLDPATGAVKDMSKSN